MILDRLHQYLVAASSALAVIAGWTVLLYSIALSAEVVARKFLAVSIQGFDEYGGYMLAVTSAVGLTYAMLTRAHIRVDVFLHRMPLRWRSWVDALAAISLGLFAVALLASSYVMVASSWRLQARAVSPLQTPLVVPQGLWALALGLFLLACILVSIIAVRAAMRRDWNTVEKVAGVPTPSEEVAEEVDAARQRGVTSNDLHL